MGNGTGAVKRRADRPSATPAERQNAVRRAVSSYRSDNARRFAQAHASFLSGRRKTEPDEDDYEIGTRRANNIRTKIENASRQGR